MVCDGVNTIQVDTATAALWEAFQQRLVQDVIPSDFLQPGMNICRILLSINTLITDDTIILFQEQGDNDFSRTKPSACFHTAL